MEISTEKLIEVIKQQAELFLLDGGGFYPFATYINLKNEIVPVGAYLEEDRANATSVLNLLQKHFEKIDYMLAAIAVDINLHENEKTFDAIEIHFLEKNKDRYKKHFKYSIKENSVLFSD